MARVFGLLSKQGEILSESGNGRKALVLGGTEFLGRHLVDGLITTGWQVTLFNRGKTNPDLYPTIERLRGDRAIDTSALEGGQWDVVFDLSGYHPDDIDRVADALGGQATHYVFVSTVSAYEDFDTDRVTESRSLAVLEGPLPSSGENESYGALKALCEKRVVARFPSHLIIRPCVIAGVNDPTGRFTYWVDRLTSPGDHIVPPDLDSSVQVIDVRDIASWMIQAGAHATTGIFNAAGHEQTFRQLIDTISQFGASSSRSVTYLRDELEAQEVKPWTSLPLWLPPEDVSMRGFFRIDASRAIEAGLRIRPVSDTVHAILEWIASDGLSESAYGISRERELEIAAHLAAQR